MRYGFALRAALCTAVLAGGVRAAQPLFVHPPAERWSVTHRHPDRPGLSLPSGEARHTRFVARGMSTAVTPWNAGTRPFSFSFGIEIEKGHRQAWRWPGVFVALLSARPEEMTDSDLALSMSVHLQGPMVTVRQGGFFDIYEQRPRAWRWRGNNVAPRYTLNMSGAGGYDYSIRWPGKRLDGTTLYFRLRRKRDHEIVFSIYHHEGGNTPWWTGTFTLPDELADVPMKWVAVKSMVHRGDPDKPVPEGDQLRGRIAEMRGRVADGGAPPLAPFEEPPPVEPAMRDVAGLPHPHIWFTADELPDLRRKFNEPLLAPYRKLILGRANRPPEEIGKTGTPSHAAILHAYLWAYLLSERPAYKARLMEAVDALLVGSDRLPAETQGHPGHQRKVIKIDEFMCHNAEAIATVYDTLLRELTPEQRTRMFRYLKRHLHYYLRRLDANDWWYRNNPSNTVAVGSGTNGIAALALRPLVKQAEQAVERAVKTIHEHYKAMADDGGCVEGNLYWDYGFTCQLLFGHALKHVTGDDRGLLTSDSLLKTPRFVRTQLGGDGRYFTFNDTQPWLTGLAVCADFGSRLDDPLLRWMADRTAREAARGTTPVFTRPQFYALAFRARDRTPAPDAFPGVPTLAHLETLNWGVLRSGGASFKPALVLGVKGRGGPTTHHAQADLSGFVLQAGGESFLIDPGYYQPKAEHHSVPLIGGKGPDKRGRALITDAWEKGPLRTMTVDATHAYKAAGATRVRRVFVLYGDRVAAVLDDIECDGVVTAQYQCGFPTELNADRTRSAIRGQAGAVTVRPHLPGLKLAVEGPVDFGRSWVFAETGVEWYQVRGDYTADPERPLVTVFLPSESGAATCERRGSEIRMVMNKDPARVVRFEKTDAGWTVVRVP